MPNIITTWAKLPEDEFNDRRTRPPRSWPCWSFVLLINSIAIVLRNRFEKKRSS